MSDPNIIEAAVRAMRANSRHHTTQRGVVDGEVIDLDAAANAMLAAVTPLIRAQVLEEAAKVADNHPREVIQSSDIGDAIRALKEQP